MVGTGVYEGGFEGLRAYLRRVRGGVGAPCCGSGAGHAAGHRADPGVVVTAFGGPEVLRFQPVVARRPGPGEVRIRQTAVGVN